MHTILVADDSVTILKAVEIVFDKEPFQVVKAGSGAEAIARAKELRPALVLADHHMGDKSGYEVAEALHADPSTSGIPIMILTAGSAPYDEGRARAAGVIGNVQKPFDCQTLLDRVRNALGVPATAPGTAVVSGVTSAVGGAASSSAALAGMPRPPGIGGGAGAASMPRPPGLGGLGRPAGAGAPASSPSQSTSPLAAAVAAAPMNRAPTPQPARTDLDPFGFGAVGATPAAASPAPVSTPPRPTTGSFNNPFATATAIGATATAIGGPAMTSPSSITAQPAASAAGAEPWRTARGGDALDHGSAAAKPATSPFASLSSAASLPSSTPSVSPSTVSTPGLSSSMSSSFTSSVTSAASSSPPSSAATKTAPPSYVSSESEFLEVADIEVSDIPSTPVEPKLEAKPAPTAERTLSDARATDKLDISALARMDSEAQKRASTSTAVSLEPASAAQIVAEKAATVIAKAGGVAPSKEALTEEARQIVERVAWEVVPELAEVIIREEIQRLLKSRT